jgi:IS5 family transposase
MGHPAPDETTIPNFRRLLETHDLCGKILDVFNHRLASKAIRISTGAIVDSTIIPRPVRPFARLMISDVQLLCNSHRA